MSLLWRETLRVGLFPDHCWLTHGKGTLDHMPVGEAGGTGERLLAALAAMLAEHSAQVRKGGRVSLLVSDSIAAITTLPWQGELNRSEERQAYAAACFEQQNLEIGSDWVMRADFRHYGTAGLAYALPRAWLNKLIELLEAFGLKLQEVLPVSAAAYYRHRPKRGNACSLLLLQESTRATVLRYVRHQLASIDVEPVTQGNGKSGTRLMTRVAAETDKIDTVFEWSAVPPESAKLADYVASVSPAAEQLRVRRGAWG